MTSKAAIIGFGGMGRRHHAAYQKNGVDVVAICDWDKDAVRSHLPDFAPERIFDNHDDLLAAADFDIVSIVTNGPTHAEVAIKAAGAGIKNILCEKPIATNPRDARRVIDACAARGSRLAVNHIRRWSEDYRRIKRLLDEGVIGDLRGFYFNCGSTGLGNFTSHFFDAARMLSGGEAERVVGWLDKTATANPRGAQFIDPAGYGFIYFSDGLRFTVDTSEETGVQYLFTIVGQYGRIIIDELNASWIIRTRESEDRELPLTRYGAPMPVVPFASEGEFDIVELTGRAQAELLAGGDISCTGEDGKKSLEMVVAFHASEAAGNAPVALPLTGADLERDVPIG